MLKIKFLILMIFGVQLAIGADLANKLQQVANKTRYDYDLSALAVSVILPNESQVNIYSGTIARNNPKKIDQQSLFQIGSITKTFVASSILVLASENKLKLSDKLGKYFPQYPKWKDITILQLLNQTSGLFSYDYSPTWWQLFLANPTRVWSESELLAVAYQSMAYFPVGNGWHYSNTNYILLGMVVQQVTHEPLASAFKELLPNLPNNIYYIPYNLDNQIGTRLVHGYHYKYDSTNENTSWLMGAGGIISNPQAISFWYWDLFHNQVLNADSLNLIKQFVDLKTGKRLSSYNNFGYGLGVFTMPSPYGVIWFTPGVTSGYMSIVAYLPCKNIVIAYTSATVPNGRIIHMALLNNILKAIGSKSADPVNSFDSQVCKDNKYITNKFIFPRF